ncbi:MAG: hypothetical protein HC895_17010, partial [Leptolyngbyaceae cyanobacterium SM1_3_5]|nr:hypothetical protein [Leptolyngbyaceae cyanobacterium SM1_3_5]
FDRQPMSQNWRDRLFDRSTLQAAFRLNGDILIRTFTLISTFALFTNLSSSLGTLTLATNSLMLQVVTLAAYFIDGIAFATESFAGQFHGQQDRSQLTRLLRLAGGSSLLLGLVLGGLFALQPIALFCLLTNHNDILAEVPRFAIWLIPVLGFGGVAYMLDGYFLGLTAGAILRRSSLIASLIGFAPIALLAWKFQSSHLLLACPQWIYGGAIDYFGTARSCHAEKVSAFANGSDRVIEPPVFYCNDGCCFASERPQSLQPARSRKWPVAVDRAW